MRHSIRVKLLSVFFAIIAVFALVFLGVNTFILEDIYIADYQKKILETYEELKESFVDDSDLKQSILATNKVPGAYITIVDSNLSILSTTAPEVLLEKQLNNAMKQRLITFRNSEQNESVIDIIDYGESSESNKKMFTLIGFLSDDRLIIMERPMGSIKSIVDVAVTLSTIASIIALIVGFVLLFFLSGHFTKPILRINQKALEIANLNFQGTLKIKNKDEIGQLGKSIMEISSKLEF